MEANNASPEHKGRAARKIQRGSLAGQTAFFPFYIGSGKLEQACSLIAIPKKLGTAEQVG